MPTTAERESARLAWRLGIGRGDPPEPEPEPEAPTAPVLSVVSVVGTTVTLSFVVDETIGEGDNRQVQIQPDGGDWSSTIVDDTAALTSGEAGASSLEIDIPTPDAGTYEVRMRVREGDSGPWSGWSNVDEYVIEAPPSRSYIARAIQTSESAPSAVTFSVDISDAASDRKVVIFAVHQNGDAVTSITVNGTSLTEDVVEGTYSRVAAWSGAVTSGSGVVDVVVTWTSGAFVARGIFPVIMYGDNELKDTASNGADISVEAGDYLFALLFGASTPLTMDGWEEVPNQQTATLAPYWFAAGDLDVAGTDAAFSTGPDSWARCVVVFGPA